MKTIYTWSTKKFKLLLQEKFDEIDSHALTNEIKDWQKSCILLDECETYSDYQIFRLEFRIKYEFSKKEFLCNQHPYISDEELYKIGY